MRVTNQMVVTEGVRRLSSRLNEYEQAQSRLATGKDVRKPSDDPAAANRGLSLRAAERSRVQEARNAEDALSWLNVTDSQLQEGMNTLHRARELTVRASNAMGPSEREAIAKEVEALRDELMEIANAKLRGNHLFAGYTSGPAVAWDEGTGEYTFQGADGDAPHEITRRVGETERVRVNVTAAEAFGDADGDELENTFAALDTLVDRLRDPAAHGSPSESLPALDEARERLGDSLATVGAQTNRVESAIARSEDMRYHIQNELSQVEDADYAEAVMELQLQDVALQSTLQALGRALPPSLASFLR